MSNDLLTITLSTHNFAVNPLTPRAIDIVTEFSKKTTQYGLARVPGGKYIYCALRLFGFSSPSGTEFRFHINQYKDFIDHLTSNYINDNLYSVTTKDVPVPIKVELTVKSHWKPRDHQPPIIKYLTDDLPFRSRFVDLQTGQGKLQPLDAKIKVPGGWSTMGEMKVGTQVIAKDGTTTEVTAVYPQGIVDVYKLTFADGRSTEAGAEHLWKVYYINTQPHKRWRVVDTLEVLRLISMPNPRVYIDLCDSEISPDIALPIDPYFLGLILGNGCLTGASITYSTQDQCTIDYIQNILPTSVSIKHRSGYDYAITNKVRDGKGNVVIQSLRDLGLFGKLSNTKFVPSVYLSSSTQQRLAILQGLLDTDGTVGKDGNISFGTTSNQLAKDVQYLVRSLGGIAAISNRQTHFTYKDVKKTGLPSFYVGIRFKKGSELFRVERKKQITNDENQYSDSLKLRVSNVELVGKKEAQCISISHPDQLYVTDDFIVTHNTFVALNAAAQIGSRLVIIVKAGYVEKWIEDVLKTYEISVDEIMMVKGTANLQALITMAKQGLLDSKVIIIGNKCMQAWFKLYALNGKWSMKAGYDCLPSDFYETIGAGVRLIDEVHQEFHLNYMLDIYTNIERSISLSATLVNNDKFLEKMYDVAYPLLERYSGTPLKRYVNATSVHYVLEDENSVRTTEFGSPTYSHHAFEKSILRHRGNMKNNYFDLVDVYIKDGFIRDYKKGEKCLIFCSGIDFCTALCEYLTKVHPELVVKRYVEDDPLSNLLGEGDIVVSTILSSGTAHDIANLKTVILTVAVDSIQANIQSLGRLREIPGVITRFYYFVCLNVPKHVEYGHRKEKMLMIRANKFRQINAPYYV